MLCSTTSESVVPRCPLRSSGGGVMSETALVTEITYDRALVCLAAERGIDVAPNNFVHPKIERERLEVELVRRGVDLEIQARRPSSEAPDPAAGGPRTLNRSDLPE